MAVSALLLLILGRKAIRASLRPAMQLVTLAALKHSSQVLRQRVQMPYPQGASDSACATALVE